MFSIDAHVFVLLSDYILRVILVYCITHLFRSKQFSEKALHTCGGRVVENPIFRVMKHENAQQSQYHFIRAFYHIEHGSMYTKSMTSQAFEPESKAHSISSPKLISGLCEFTNRLLPVHLLNNRTTSLITSSVLIHLHIDFHIGRRRSI